MGYQYSLTRRVVCLIMGLLLLGLGVALSTRPELGSSPISSPSYALTFVFSGSLGFWLVIVNFILVGGQILILRKEFQLLQLTQLLVACCLGFFVDIGMWITQFYIPDNYALRMIEQLFGCLFIALGVICQIAANLFYIPGEGFIKCISTKYRWHYGTVKIFVDSSLVIIAIAISVIGTGKLQGVREGTIVAAILVGFLVRRMDRPLRSLKKLLIKKATFSNSFLAKN